MAYMASLGASAIGAESKLVAVWKDKMSMLLTVKLNVGLATKVTVRRQDLVNSQWVGLRKQCIMRISKPRQLGRICKGGLISNYHCP